MINAHTHGGLGNRLKNVVSCMKLSDEHNLPINITWDKKPYVCNCNFDDLYENNFSINKKANFKINYPFGPFSCWRLYVSDKDNIPNNFTKIKKNFLGNTLNNANIFTKFIDLEYNRIPLEIKTQYINYFKSLKLKKELQEKIDNFSNKYFNEKTISVHFRGICKGDSDYWPKNYKEYIKKRTDEYVNEMKKYSSDYNFYITCVNNNTIDYFKNIFKDRIISYEKIFCSKEKNEDRNSKEGIQNDLIELYLLSKNNIIIGSHSSTFTEVAWYLGGCTSNITII